jgi:aldehyde:ferredoxin oxidoreductase
LGKLISSDISCGWAGRVARIDLSTRSVKTEGTESYREWLGGRGLASYILFKEVPVGADPLSPENIVVISVGPLTGTLSPCSGRVNMTSMNALTHGYASANAGGYFAPELKYAGFDAVIIGGASKSPVYLFIHNGTIEICPGDGMWGLTTTQCYEAVKAEVGEEDARVLCIGPAGEKQCRIANVVVDKGRSASYGGIGAILGAKKLKAIVVKGDSAIHVSRPEEFMQLAGKTFTRIGESEILKNLGKLGTLPTAPPGPTGREAHVVRNYQDGVWEREKTKRVDYSHFIEKHKVRDLACFNCAIGCSKLYRYPAASEDEKSFEGFQANHITNFGSMIDNDDPGVILAASALSNELGLDVDSAACSIAWAFECFEREKLSVSECNGLRLRWGNTDAVLPLLQAMARREGLGDLLADGPLEAARRLGRGTEEWAMSIKGAALREINMQTDMSWALGVTVSARGSGHLNGAVRVTNLSKMRPEELTLLGLDGIPDESDPEVGGHLVAWFEDFKSVVDSLGLCYFATWWIDGSLLGPTELALLYGAATGENVTPQELLRRGARIHNVEKAFNVLHAGFARKDDIPPARLFDRPISQGINKGAVLERDKWSAFLDGYYRARNYDTQSGWQTHACLRELGLQEVEERLREAGKLID